MFKQYRINRLKVKVAVYEALEADSLRFTKGNTNEVFINKHQEHLRELTRYKAKLAILEGKQ